MKSTVEECLMLMPANHELNPSPINVKFPPGDIRILRSQDTIRKVEIEIGGVHSIGIRNPCQTFSLAGKKEGFSNETGQLLWDCVTIVRGFEESSSMPACLAENVSSTKDVNEASDEYLPDRGSQYFYVCGSICSPCIRRQKFATNRPPTSKISLDGDREGLSASAVIKEQMAPYPKRMVHPFLKKISCLMHSDPKNKRTVIWEQTDPMQPPIQKQMNPEEAERAMGHREDEFGVTEFTAEAAVQKRILEHDYERDGCLISLKDCGHQERVRVDDTRRCQLLGNSQVVPLLEGLLWNEKLLFPSTTCNLQPASP